VAALVGPATNADLTSGNQKPTEVTMSAVALATPSVPRFTRRKPWNRAEAQETERQLLIRYHRDGDLAAREELTERFLPLARDLALRYTYTDEPFDDLLQVASLGLIKAIDRFEPGRGTKFTSYAAPTILGELKRHFRDKGWALHVPRDLQERTLAVSRASEDLSKSLGRSPKRRRSSTSWATSTRPTSSSRAATRSPAPGRRCRTWSGRYWSCASCTT
jgi:RNA polymerase sigma factor (sigma-70 family)